MKQNIDLYIIVSLVLRAAKHTGYRCDLTKFAQERKMGQLLSSYLLA
ncbi:hypothetical protein [Prevotella sp.]|nr:hypothetical protein [uncultured Prevotella sp.]